MDVAAFVGFAEKGPLNIPVVVEEFTQFRDIFGDDLELAWDSDRGSFQKSLLGSSVEAFFRNGGLKCWVVRVAAELRVVQSGEHSPLAFNALNKRRFNLPGVYQLDGPVTKPAQLSARSPGPWGDNLRVGTRVRSLSLTAGGFAGQTTFDSIPDGYLLRVRSVPADISSGDLFEIRFDDSTLFALGFLDHVQGRELTLDTLIWLEQGNAPSVLSDLEGLSRYQVLLAGDPQLTLSIRRLSLDLLVWENGELSAKAENLAFHSRHPRCFSRLPSDELLFGSLLEAQAEEISAGIKELLNDVNAPRFSLGESELTLSSYLHPSEEKIFFPFNVGNFTEYELASFPRSIELGRNPANSFATKWSKRI